MRRWAGTSSGAQSSGETRVPVCRSQALGEHVEQRPRRTCALALDPASTCAARSGAGTRLRRTAFGSARISAVDQLVPQARGPASRTRSRLHAGEQGERDVHGHAVGGRARARTGTSAAAPGSPGGHVVG